VLRDHHVNFSNVFNILAVGQLVASALLLMIRLSFSAAVTLPPAGPAKA
jgi:hypothetical protein